MKIDFKKILVFLPVFFDALMSILNALFGGSSDEG